MNYIFSNIFAQIIRFSLTLKILSAILKIQRGGTKYRLLYLNK